MWDEDLLSKDDFMGMVTVPVFPDLDDEEPKEAWYTLQQRKAKDKVKGDVKLKFHYISTMRMDDHLIAQYLKFSQYLLRDLDLVMQLCGATTEKKDDVSRILVNIFNEHNCVDKLIQKICKKEVEQTLGESTLFRTDSIGTKMTTSFCKIVGLSYLKHTLAHPVSVLVKEANQMEVDPNRLKSASDASRNIETLKRVSQSFLDAILESLDSIPSVLREIGTIISQEVTYKFPEARRVSMAGYFFLRFMCPPFLNPKKYELVDDVTFNDQVQRAFILVAKILQNMANGVQFGGKEAYMTPLNDVILSNQPRVVAFLDALPTNATTSRNRAKSLTPEMDRGLLGILAHDIKLIHRHFVSTSVSEKLTASLGIEFRSAGYDVGKLLDLLPTPKGFRDLSQYSRSYTTYMIEYHKQDPEDIVNLSTKASSPSSEVTEKGLETSTDLQATKEEHSPVVHELDSLLEQLQSGQPILNNEQLEKQDPQLKNNEITQSEADPSNEKPSGESVDAIDDELAALLGELEKQVEAPSKAGGANATEQAAQGKQTPLIDNRLEESYYVSLPSPPEDEKICMTCLEEVSDSTSYASACGRRWHVNHFHCNYCGSDLTGVVYYEKYKRPFCEKHYGEIFSPKCHGCQKPVIGKYLQAIGKTFHTDCFSCGQCQIPLESKTFYQKANMLICGDCFLSTAPRCAHCEEPIVGRHLSALNRSWHVEHFICCSCSQPIALGKGYRQHEGKPLCETCKPPLPSS
eukprot:TRINITY_DN5147_c0_g1_i1.p1 TRINITY_DN5147_c0_g1~~TRINITY_DN5147_c0_g1_i1.p1  ORF type:complete len:745 (-),score=128.17 TRINITY_DN5147_c0_g1_i1:180-2414(-)